MTDTVIDPLAGLDAGISPDAARDHVAVLVKGGGIGLDQANAALAGRGAAPLTANSREMAEAQRDALLASDEFVKAYAASDPQAIAKLFQADLRVQQSSGKLTDRPTRADEYTLNVAGYMPSDTPAERVLAYGKDLQDLSAAVQLPKESAQVLTDLHMAAVRREAVSTRDDNEAYGNEQTADLHAVLGADAEAKLKAASEILTNASGRKLDLSAIVRSNGAEMALMLYHQSQALARK